MNFGKVLKRLERKYKLLTMFKHEFNLVHINNSRLIIRAKLFKITISTRV